MPRPLRGTAALLRPSRKGARVHDALDACPPGGRWSLFPRVFRKDCPKSVDAFPLSYMGPFSLSFFQGIPDAAHWSLPKSSMCFGSSVNDSPWCEPRAGNVQVSFPLGNPSEHSVILVPLALESCRVTLPKPRRPIRISSCVDQKLTPRVLSNNLAAHSTRPVALGRKN